MLDPKASDGIWGWFSTNAPAAWISALIATVSLLLVLRSRKQPKKLVIREVKNSSLIKIWPGIRDKITVSFGDRQVGSLGQMEIELLNSGSEVIEHASCTLQLSKDAHVLGTVLRPEYIESTTLIEDSTIKINIPYLNPMREHEQVMKLSILVEGDAELVDASGMGQGWSVRLERLPSLRRVKMYSYLLLTVILIDLPFAFFYFRYLEKHWRIPISEISWKAFFAQSPGVLPAAVCFLLLFRLFHNQSTSRGETLE